MESESNVSIIFRQLSSNQLYDILEHHGATKNETKAIFLMRDLSAGLITVSYYSREHEMVQHLRLGLTEDGWKTVPKPPKEPFFTATLEVKTKYIQDKAKFDKQMQIFFNTAKTLLNENATPKHLQSLGHELRNNKFQKDGLIRPSPMQASQERHYFDYLSNLLLNEDTPSPAKSIVS
ncbi:Uncharacterised protein [Legionella wadsworthii]|uniref:Uncharacterized protein n=1 Tax=Legionella wadsworthii TaxID=28088 RepID=A0A378LQU2_9GAMM|nr:hypothetical protein [Legionella wadsworthii]STY29077.1 Uncharacterised protein [Legionella wadsworthii]